MATVQLVLAPDSVRSDLTAETAARISADTAERTVRAAADAAIIASGATPANVGIAPVIATGSGLMKTVADWLARLTGTNGDPITSSGFDNLGAWRSGGKRLALFTTEYQDKVVTVPAPQLAPSPWNWGSMYGVGAFLAGKDYEVAYSLIGWAGESALSPSLAITGTGVGAVAIDFPGLPAGDQYVGICIYVQNVTDDPGVFRRAYVPPSSYPQPSTYVQPGDVSDTLGGIIVSPNDPVVAPPHAGGTVFPATNDAVDADGGAIAAPAQAPTHVMLSTIPAGAYYAAYSFVCEDGTETALSPASSAVVATAAAGSFFSVRHEPETINSLPNGPPSGAVFVRDYLSTDGVNWHLQGTFPLHYVTNYLYRYDSGGAAHSAGAAQSTICPLQQAIDEAEDSDVRMIVFPSSAGPMEHKVPIIVRSNRSVPGLLIQGFGAGNEYGYGQGKLSYTGALSGVENVVNTGTAVTWERIDANDPNSRCSYGLALCDFAGGQSFYNTWRNCGFTANGPSGRGLIVSIFSHTANSHTASEQTFEDVGFHASAWGVELHGSQTVNFRFRMLHTNAGAVGNGANTGQFRTFGIPATIDGHNMEGPGRCAYHLSGEKHPFANEYSSLYSIGAYNEWQFDTNCVFLSISSTNLFASATIVQARQTRNPSACTHKTYAVCCPAAASVKFIEPAGIAGHTYLNYGTWVPNSGPDATVRFSIYGDPFNVGWGDSFKNVLPKYSGYTDLSMTAPIALRNEDGDLAKIGTNERGDVRFVPHSGALDLSSALPEYADNAAALAGGLVAGNLYHTAGAVKVVT